MEKSNFQKMVKKYSAVTLLGAASVMGASAVAADEYVLSYSEKELANFAGVENVHTRIVKAAKQYCPSYSSVRSLADVRTCVDGVVEDLVAKIDHPKMTSYHQGFRGEQVAISVSAEK